MRSLLKASGVAVLLAAVCLLAANGGVQASRMGGMRMLHHDRGMGTTPSAVEDLMSFPGHLSPLSVPPSLLPSSAVKGSP